MAENQIAILNADFNGENSDLSDWNGASSHYPDTETGSVGIKFVIATENHPTVDPDVTEGNPAVTIGYNFGGGGDSDSTWAGYLNFLVKPINGSLLGYSPLGGNPLYGDAIVMNTFAFGDNTAGCGQYTSSYPYDLGRTVTHELGHHFSLNHIWGQGAGSCGTDDGITDTPNSASATYGTPANGSIVQCGSKNLTMNFMDYTNDAYMYMFSEGQAQNIRAYINSIHNDYHDDRVDPVIVEEVEQENEDNVSVSEFAKDFAFDVYPNPASDHLYIKMNNELVGENLTVQMYDVTGKMVYEVGSNGQFEEVINTSNLNDGVYFIKVFSGNKYYADKVVISKK